jgi:hypothetical protein
MTDSLACAIADVLEWLRWNGKNVAAENLEAYALKVLREQGVIE